MKTVKVTFTSGEIITTDINGSDESIREYYKVGRMFNLGSVGDRMVAVSSVVITN